MDKELIHRRNAYLLFQYLSVIYRETIIDCSNERIDLILSFYLLILIIKFHDSLIPIYTIIINLIYLKTHKPEKS